MITKEKQKLNQNITIPTNIKYENKSYMTQEEQSNMIQWIKAWIDNVPKQKQSDIKKYVNVVKEEDRIIEGGKQLEALPEVFQQAIMSLANKMKIR